jgi:hypothetical protein
LEEEMLLLNHLLRNRKSAKIKSLVAPDNSAAGGGDEKKMTFDRYFENRTPTQLEFLEFVDGSGAGINELDDEMNDWNARNMLKSGDPELLGVLGAATIIAHYRNPELEKILLGEEGNYDIVKEYLRGGKARVA